MYKLLLLSLHTRRQQQKAAAKQLPVIEHATRGKKPEAATAVSD
jgi:hypothetical protein